MTSTSTTKPAASTGSAGQFAASSAGSGKWLISNGARGRAHAVIFGASEAANSYAQRLNVRMAASRKHRHPASAARSNVHAG